MELLRILVGVDRSGPSALATRTAFALARRFDAEVFLVHVCEMQDWPAWLDYSMHDTAEGLERRLDEHVDLDGDRFREFCDRHAVQGVRTSRILTVGAPDWDLLDAVKEVSPDLVVLGSRGLGQSHALTLGSVAESVARRAPCSVLVVRDHGGPATGFRRVVVASNFSAPAIRATELGRTIAGGEERVDLIHCWRIPSAESLDDGPAETDSDEDPMAAAVYAQIDEAGCDWVADKIGAGADVRFRLVNQTPIQGIQDWIEKRDCDLVVLGNVGFEGVRKPLLGRTAGATLRRSPSSVLIAR